MSLPLQGLLKIIKIARPGPIDFDSRYISPDWISQAGQFVIGHTVDSKERLEFKIPGLANGVVDLQISRFDPDNYALYPPYSMTV